MVQGIAHAAGYVNCESGINVPRSNNLLQGMAGDVFHDHERQAITVEIGGRSSPVSYTETMLGVARPAEPGFTAESIDHHRVAAVSGCSTFTGRPCARGRGRWPNIHLPCRCGQSAIRSSIAGHSDQPWQAGRQKLIVAHGASLCSSFAASGDSVCGLRRGFGFFDFFWSGGNIRMSLWYQVLLRFRQQHPVQARCRLPKDYWSFLALGYSQTGILDALLRSFKAHAGH